MKKVWLYVLAAMVLCCGLAWSQGSDVAGTWQGMMKVPGHDLRTVMKITKGDGGALKTTIYSIDQGGQPIPITTTVLTGTVLKLSIVSAGVSYEGKLNAEGTAMTGTFTQGGQAIPLDFAKVTEAASWTIPEAKPKVLPMPADAKPVFEVATIKPSKPDTPGKGFLVDGRSFKTTNTTLVDLLTFAYSVQQKQIIGGPAWTTDEKYDLLAQPDIDGQPNQEQLRGMVKKLLEERFALKMHTEKKELPAFALTVAKGGEKMAKSDGDPKGLPGLFFQGLGILTVRNASMQNFANLMQSAVLDRPVVDKTGLTGRYDFMLKWAPDDSQFGGMGIKYQPPTDAANAPPDLFKAVQEQMGVRLDAVKTQVEVLVLDHVEKPSNN